MASKPHIFAWVLFLIAGSVSLCAAEDSAWVQTFNGKDLDGWTPYFQKTGVVNTGNTYKYSPEGYLFIDIQTSYNITGYGHLFYTKKKLSYYMVRTQYRFPTATYGPDWNFGGGGGMQNNGLMIHSQDPLTMKGKDFPTSIEVQLLGKANPLNADQRAKGFKYGTSANVCTPYTFMAWNGIANYTIHCTAAQYPSIWKNTEIPWDDPDGWSDVTVRVLSDSLVQHFIHGSKVFEYTRIREDDGTPLKSGYISLQCEGTSTQFKTLEILDLVGCMDKTNSAYRSYFVKNDQSTCATVSIRGTVPAGPFRLVREGSALRVSGNGARIIGVRNVDGSWARGFSEQVSGQTFFQVRDPGLYLVSIKDVKGESTVKTAWF